MFDRVVLVTVNIENRSKGLKLLLERGQISQFVTYLNELCVGTFVFYSLYVRIKSDLKQKTGNV